MLRGGEKQAGGGRRRGTCDYDVLQLGGSASSLIERTIELRRGGVHAAPSTLSVYLFVCRTNLRYPYDLAHEVSARRRAPTFVTEEDDHPVERIATDTIFSVTRRPDGVAAGTIVSRLGPCRKMGGEGRRAKQPSVRGARDTLPDAGPVTYMDFILAISLPRMTR